MCGFIHGFVWYFNLFTIYTEALIGFMLCHTTSNLPPNYSNRTFFIRVLLPSLVPIVRRKNARWSESTQRCSALTSSHDNYTYIRWLAIPLINCYSYICGYLIVFDKKKIRLNWWYMYMYISHNYTDTDLCGWNRNCRKLSVNSIFTVDMMTSYKTVTCCARGDPCQMKFEFRTTLYDLCSSSRSLYTFLQWVNHCTAVTRVH